MMILWARGHRLEVKIARFGAACLFACLFIISARAQVSDADIAAAQQRLDAAKAAKAATARKNEAVRRAAAKRSEAAANARRAAQAADEAARAEQAVQSAKALHDSVLPPAIPELAQLLDRNRSIG